MSPFGLVTVRITLDLLFRRNYRKKFTLLYTTCGIDVAIFAPDETDIRPPGIFVTNKKGVPIKCLCTLISLWANKAEIDSAFKNLPLGWFEGSGKYNFEYTTIEKRSSKILVLQRIKSMPTPHVVVEVNNPEIKVFSKDLVFIEHGITQTYLVKDRQYKADIQFSFDVNGVSFVAPVLKFLFESDGKNLIIKKLYDWNDPRKIK